MNARPPHLYRRHGVAEGVSDAVLDAATPLVARAYHRGLPAVLSLKHLSRLTGAEYLYLRAVIDRSADPYTDITRPSRVPGRLPRSISSPNPVMLEVQRWLLTNILNTLTPHSASFAYQRGKSVIDCAERHLGADWLIKFDLRDFFHSINERRVYPVYAGLGYSQLVAFELTRLSTRLLTRSVVRRARRSQAIPSYGTAEQGVLPQGSPASGMLANLVAAPLDDGLSQLALERQLVYTRYSDDLTFSVAGGSFSRAKAQSLVAEVLAVVWQNGFLEQRRKLRVVPPGGRKIVLGIQVHGDVLRLQPEVKRDIENHIRGVATFGLLGHAEHRNFVSVLGFVRHVDGLLAYASSVEPSWAAGARGKWQRALQASGFPYGP